MHFQSSGACGAPRDKFRRDRNTFSKFRGLCDTRLQVQGPMVHLTLTIFALARDQTPLLCPWISALPIDDLEPAPPPRQNRSIAPPYSASLPLRHASLPAVAAAATPPPVAVHASGVWSHHTSTGPQVVLLRRRQLQAFAQLRIGAWACLAGTKV
jgi:hypothetical protein